MFQWLSGCLRFRFRCPWFDRFGFGAEGLGFRIRFRGFESRRLAGCTSLERVLLTCSLRLLLVLTGFYGGCRVCVYNGPFFASTSSEFWAPRLWACI